MSLLVADRAQEIGIRLALGAQRGAILKMILSQGAALTCMGIAIGLVSAVFLTRLLEKVVYGVTTSDPLTFVTVPLLLGTVALVAAFTPARRASRLDPIATLRR